MYEDLLTALQYISQHRDDPMVNMFNISHIASDCTDAIAKMNEQLAQITAERDQYRNDSIQLSLLLLCSSGRTCRGADAQSIKPQTLRQIPAKE